MFLIIEYVRLYDPVRVQR